MNQIDLDTFGQDFAKEEKERKTKDFYKIKEGDNKMRILTYFTGVEAINRGEKYAGIVSEKNQPEDEDTVSFKGWAWAVIRETGELKIVQLSRRVLAQISALKNDPEYKWNDESMPFDINIKATNAGKTDVQYSVVPARTSTPVTDAEKKELATKTAVSEIVERMIAKQDGKGSSMKPAITKDNYPKEDIDPNNIPF